MHRLLSAVAVLLAATAARAEDLTFCKQGLGAQQAGNYDLAIADYGRCLSEGQLSVENQARYLYNRGLTYFILLQLDRAIADYDAAIRLEPDLAIAFNNRCVAQAILGRMAQAVSDCDRALQLSPDNAAFLDSRGEAFLRGHDYARAVADYDAAIKLSAAQGV